MNLIDILRNNIIHSDGKTFGSLFEILVTSLGDLKESNYLGHDRFCSDNQKRIEVKACRAFKSNKKSGKKLVKWMLQENSHKSLVYDAQKNTDGWNSNIGQIKPNYFDILFYAAVFHDRIYIFAITSEQIIKEKWYCSKQHRDGLMGQMHIGPNNIDYHIKNYLYKSLSYEQLIAILVANIV